MERRTTSGATAHVNDLLTLIQQRQKTSHSGIVMTVGAIGNHYWTHAVTTTPQLVRNDHPDMQNLVNSLQGHFMGQRSAVFVPDSTVTNLHHQQQMQNNTILQRELSLDEHVALQAMTHNKPQMEQMINDVANILKPRVGVTAVTGFPLRNHHLHGRMATPFVQASRLGLIVHSLLRPAQGNGPANKARYVKQQQDYGEATASETTSNALMPDNPEGGSTMDSFPFKLYRLLAFVEKEGMTHIISFLPDGTTFKIHDKQAFVTEILPYFFNTNRLASFYRQLNQYSFKRVTKGVFRGGFHNQHFMKGNPLSCKNIMRKKRSPSKKPPPAKSDLPDGASKRGDAPKQAAQVMA